MNQGDLFLLLHEKSRLHTKSVSVDVNRNFIFFNILMNSIFIFKFIIDLHKFCYETQLLVLGYKGYLETKNFLIVQIRAGLDNQTT